MKEWNELYFSYFLEATEQEKELENNPIKFPITYDNFTDYIVEENKAIFDLKQDKWVKFKWTKPWTKAWFEEDETRKEYLKPENFARFKK